MFQSLTAEEVISEDEARKRREQLNRRPSYRYVLFLLLLLLFITVTRLIRLLCPEGDERARPGCPGDGEGAHVPPHQVELNRSHTFED